MDPNSTTPRRSQRIQSLHTGVAVPPIAAVMDETPSKRKIKRITRRSPFLPTTFEAALLSIYPVTLIIGSLFSLIDPSTRSAPYSALTQSHVESTAPSYFAKKSNLINRLFVKQGWFWITLSYALFILTHPFFGAPGSPSLTPRRLRGIMRWGIVTLWWFLVTQWFFGPAIIDRGFLLTGGQCDMVKAAQDGQFDMQKQRQMITHVACKAVGGNWKGGHDISGHVFLLVLGSMFLLEEVSHVLLRGHREERTILTRDGAVKSAEVEAESGKEVSSSGDIWPWGVRVAIGVSGLSVFMLAMTAIYFHTWFEKLTGLLIAFCGIFVVYFLPRAIPAMRSVVGLPGM